MLTNADGSLNLWSGNSGEVREFHWGKSVATLSKFKCNFYTNNPIFLLCDLSLATLVPLLWDESNLEQIWLLPLTLHRPIFDGKDLAIKIADDFKINKQYLLGWPSNLKVIQWLYWSQCDLVSYQNMDVK